MAINGVVLLIFLGLLASSAVGVLAQTVLRERHRNAETVEAVRVVISILVTFTALVLSLLLSNVKGSYDTFDGRLRHFNGEIIELDARLREYGEGAAKIRAELRSYLAATIADTWADEPLPSGTYPTFSNTTGVERAPLGAILEGVDVAIRRLEPTDAYHTDIAGALRQAIASVIAQRQLVIETAQDTISWPLLLGMSSWLAIVFGVFGLIAPRNAVVFLTIFLCACASASAIFFILEFDTPLDGIIKVSSLASRDALAHLDAP